MSPLVSIHELRAFKYLFFLCQFCTQPLTKYLPIYIAMTLPDENPIKQVIVPMARTANTLSRTNQNAYPHKRAPNIPGRKNNVIIIFIRMSINGAAILFITMNITTSLAIGWLVLKIYIKTPVIPSMNTNTHSFTIRPKVFFNVQHGVPYTISSI